MAVYIKYIQIFSMLLIIINNSQYCSGNLLSPLKHVTSNRLFPCDLSIPPIDLSLPDLNEIIRYLRSQEAALADLKDAPKSEEDIFKQVAAYNNATDNEDIRLSASDLVMKYGYDIEEHTVTTEDGYILTLFRIPGKGSVVLLMAGILNSSDEWITAGPKNAIVYLLAKNGYDVWLGNGRGNKYGRKHKKMFPECAEFWDFSWHEIGRYDLPAIIDYILGLTGESKLSYVGYSQGCTVFFVLCSERPEYNEKISVMIALAPAVYLSHTKSPILRLLCLNDGIVINLLKGIGLNEVLPSNFLTKALFSVVCGNTAWAKIICSNSFYLLAGYSDGQLNITNLPVVMGHFPSGASTKQLVHFAQSVKSAEFRQFDYGESNNIKKYGTKTPSDYKLNEVIAPVALFYGDKDWLVDTADVKILEYKLPNVIVSKLVKNFCHLDFIQALNLKELINEPILDIIKDYT